MSGSSPRRRARSRRTARRVLLVVLVLVVTGGVVYVGIGDRHGRHAARSGPSPSASRTPRSSSSVDLSRLPIERRAFCDLLDRAAVADRPRRAGQRHQAYGSGDRVALARRRCATCPRVRLRLRGRERRRRPGLGLRAARSTATVGRSTSSPAKARGEQGCAVRPSPRVRRPVDGTLCSRTGPDRPGDAVRASSADAWLTCRLSTPSAAERRDRPSGPTSGASGSPPRWAHAPERDVA